MDEVKKFLEKRIKISDWVVTYHYFLGRKRKIKIYFIE